MIKKKSSAASAKKKILPTTDLHSTLARDLETFPFWSPPSPERWPRGVADLDIICVTGVLQLEQKALPVLKYGVHARVQAGRGRGVQKTLQCMR